MTSGKDKSNTYKSDGWVARTREQQRRRVGKIEERHLSLSLSLSLSLYVGGVWVKSNTHTHTHTKSEKNNYKKFILLIR